MLRHDTQSFHKHCISSHGFPNCVQPQISMPDVIIWMLRGEKRVACSRIPAHQILYSTFSEQACGQHCGKTQTVYLQVHMNCQKQAKKLIKEMFEPYVVISCFSMLFILHLHSTPWTRTRA